MENYSAIFRAVNEKLINCESTIKFYREELLRKEKVNKELSEEIAKLKKEIENLNF